jgi:hypothetical protein
MADGSFVGADMLAGDAGSQMGRIPTALSALGMGSPIGRFVGFTVLSGAILYISKCPPFFSADGSAKPWALLTLGKPGGKGVRSTAVPWYLVAVLIGFGMATFI